LLARRLLHTGLALASLFAIQQGITLPGASAATDEPDRSKVPAAIVILADEATGLTTSQINAERTAISNAVAYEPDPASRISVLGFGSPTQHGAPAVDVDCPSGGALGPPVGPAGSRARSDLTVCSGDLRARPADPDPTSDLVDALSSASALLGQAPPKYRRILFLMSGSRITLPLTHSGGLDTAAQRRDGARDQLIDTVPDQLAALGIEVWPVGFAGADRPVLRDLAANASPQPAPCHPEGKAERRAASVFMADDDDAIVPQMIAALAEARCTTPLGGGNAGENPVPAQDDGVSTRLFALVVIVLAATLVCLGTAWAFTTHRTLAGTRIGSVEGLRVYLFDAGAKVAVFVATKDDGRIIRLKVVRNSSNPAEPFLLKAVPDRGGYDVAVRRTTGDVALVNLSSSTTWTKLTPGRAVEYDIDRNGLVIKILDSYETRGRSVKWKRFASLSATRRPTTRTTSSTWGKFSRSISRTRHGSLPGSAASPSRSSGR